MTAELRKRQRKNIHADLTLVDDLTGETLGKIVNIHQEGMMLISQGDVQEDSVYQATVYAAAGQQINPDSPMGKISLGLDCIWRRELEQGNGYWAGFRIISASDQALAALEKLIQQYAIEHGDDPASTQV